MAAARKPGSDPKGKRRGGGLKAIGTMIPALTRRALGRHGFAHASVITDWEKIVGKGLAEQSQPVRLVFPKGERLGGTLYVRVTGPLATEMQHMEPIVLDRINGHFGYGAVARLKLIQAPIRKDEVKSPRRPRIMPPASKTELKALDEELDDVEDPEIRDVLRRLGESVLRRKKATKDDH